MSNDMAYAINHVHIRSLNPHASVAWYVKHFDANIVSEREVMPGVTSEQIDAHTLLSQHSVSVCPANRVDTHCQARNLSAGKAD